MIVGQSGVLYLVATPIGNRGDISARAREILAAAGVVAAEDTRHSGRLLRDLGLERPLVSLHEHNERARAAELVARLKAGESVALVSDAGTPLVSDPGFPLVRAAVAAGIAVVPVPGPCAAIAALSASGLPVERFCFEGFLPARAAARRQRLAELAAEPRTLVLYEAPHRLAASLEDLAAALGADRRACIARELTKVHESFYRGGLGELADRARSDPDLKRGESVIVVEGAPAAAGGATRLDETLAVLLRHLPPSAAAAVAAELTGARRNDAYARALEMAEKPARESP
ncbi:MAG: 16S rRNA (cytidine(1402)-2'-O)-methyltransferase [Steroidobacteraceae bacterium]|nr:16S rRNA (cytidine(1402)-2'-O)-methyltransferase [Steroidobacteraceae bacterium]